VALLGKGRPREEGEHSEGLLSAFLSQSLLQVQAKHTQLQGVACEWNLSEKATAGGPISLSGLFFPQLGLGFKASPRIGVLSMRSLDQEEQHQLETFN
jgi:hypothetical protein